MTLFAPQNWPIIVVSLGMIVAGVIDGWIRKVPNWLTFPLVLTGWLLGLLHTFDVPLDGGDRVQMGDIVFDTGTGGILASLACSLLGFALLFPLLFIRAMGAGDVKMQM